jgi:hydroxymethylbilane synthase
MKLRLATRGSALALAQSRWVADRLRASVPDLEIELVRIKTSGDVLPAAKWGTGGNKGLFVKEIEEALVSGAADLAVHSAKDLPADLPPELLIAAYPEREDPRDVLVSNGVRLQSLPKDAVVATASARRRLQLQKLRPTLRFVEIRGNVDTRLRKLSEGQCAALVLAAAGLKRLGVGGWGPAVGEEGTASFQVAKGGTAFLAEVLDPDRVVPAPGQGALAVEVRADRPGIIDAVRVLDHPETRVAVEVERRFMAAMGGGCRMPLGAYAQVGDGILTLRVFYASGPEDRGVHRTGRAPADGAATLAADMAAEMRSAYPTARERSLQ